MAGITKYFSECEMTVSGTPDMLFCTAGVFLHSLVCMCGHISQCGCYTSHVYCYLKTLKTKVKIKREESIRKRDT